MTEVLTERVAEILKPLKVEAFDPNPQNMTREALSRLFVTKFDDLVSERDEESVEPQTFTADLDNATLSLVLDNHNDPFIGCARAKVGSTHTRSRSLEIRTGLTGVGLVGAVQFIRFKAKEDYSLGSDSDSYSPRPEIGYGARCPLPSKLPILDAAGYDKPGLPPEVAFERSDIIHPSDHPYKKTVFSLGIQVMKALDPGMLQPAQAATS